jgi:hypothetical protein
MQWPPSCKVVSGSLKRTGKLLTTVESGDAECGTLLFKYEVTECECGVKISNPTFKLFPLYGTTQNSPFQLHNIWNDIHNHDLQHLKLSPVGSRVFQKETKKERVIYIYIYIYISEYFRKIYKYGNIFVTCAWKHKSTEAEAEFYERSSNKFLVKRFQTSSDGMNSSEMWLAG